MPIDMNYSFLARLAVAGILGAAIGFERECRAKEAGTRTHFLVAVSSCLMMIVSQWGFQDMVGLGPNGFYRCDVSRVAAQIVWTPFAELFHHESSSRGYDGSPEKSLRLQQEICLMQRKWHAFLMQGDPFYNPNLSLVSTAFAFRHPSENRLIQALLDDFNRT